ncbi:flagellar filament capping protein FliD [Aliiglaciecola sp. CAU 1673]|uniref:flagellar filament capping protein FliD n=1 Tax=Aliiglaciecola sp. CAU 1673 TaxID=3032595 RepID=UPI0023DBCC42|nr:flagellar filament capping protein FliD [Aliiglaciecola sp. CAU 1673]MDF2178313.1 flagellar filament capping protein FliD [Aliiglaciecola sp. CAU 1673]
MAGITSAGVGSGLDLEAIISALVKAENAPKQAQFTKRSSTLNITLSGVGKVKSAMDAVNSAIKTLDSSTKFDLVSAKVKAAGSEAAISVSTTSSATAGAFNIEVTQLSSGSRAQSAQNAFTSTAQEVTASGGNLTLTAGAKSFSVNLGANATLADIRDAINTSSDNFGVSANIINTGSGATLVYTSNVTGAGNDLVVSNDTAELDSVSTQANGGGAGGISIAVADQAKDAQMLIDGILVSSSTDVFVDAVQDTTITAKAVSTAGQTDKLTIAADKDAVKANIENFVTKFNEMVDVLNTAYGAGGSLAYDSATRLMREQVTAGISRQITGAGPFTSLFDLGISLSKEGKLEYSSTYGSLDDALNEDFANVGNVFAGADGLATSLGSLFDTYLQTDGVLKGRETALREDLSKLEDDKSSHAYRMEQLEKRLREQYSALDVLVAQFRSTGNYLAQQLASLPGFTTNKS